MIIGLFLIILGVIWLLSNLGVISADVSDFIWPAIIIGFGLHLVFNWKRDRNCCKSKENKTE